jgi:hypothetical protein
MLEITPRAFCVRITRFVSALGQRDTVCETSFFFYPDSPSITEGEPDFRSGPGQPVLSSPGFSRADFCGQFTSAGYHQLSA